MVIRDTIISIETSSRALDCHIKKIKERRRLKEIDKMQET